jgi:hypothetical protein
LYRRLLAQHFGVSVDSLGLARRRDGQRGEVIDSGPQTELLLPRSAEGAPNGALVAQSGQRWRAVRTRLNENRVAPASAAAKLYPAESRLGDTGLIAAAGWLPLEPIPLGDITVSRATEVIEPVVTGADQESARLRPMAAPGRRYARYSHAMRDIAPPRLWENRLA